MTNLEKVLIGAVAILLVTVAGVRYERRVASSPPPTVQAPTAPTPQQGPDRQQQARFLADADVAVQALEKVATAVEVGVGTVDYRARVTDAKIAVDRFLNTWPVDLSPALRATIERAISEFVESIRLWQEAQTLSQEAGSLRQESLYEDSLVKRR